MFSADAVGAGREGSPIVPLVMVDHQLRYAFGLGLLEFFYSLPNQIVDRWRPNIIGNKRILVAPSKA